MIQSFNLTSIEQPVSLVWAYVFWKTDLISCNLFEKLGYHSRSIVLASSSIKAIKLLRCFDTNHGKFCLPRKLSDSTKNLQWQPIMNDTPNLWHPRWINTQNIYCTWAIASMLFRISSPYDRLLSMNAFWDPSPQGHEASAETSNLQAGGKTMTKTKQLSYFLLTTDENYHRLPLDNWQRFRLSCWYG